MALSITLGAIVFVPLIFITGSAAQLPDGTIFDAYSGPDMPVNVEGEQTNLEHPPISLSGLSAPLTAEVMLEDFANPNVSPDVFRIKIRVHGATPRQFVIDNVNGQLVDPMPLQLVSSQPGEGSSEFIATINVKTLAKHFNKGINRFEVSFREDGKRTAVETILNIQM